MLFDTKLYCIRIILEQIANRIADDFFKRFLCGNNVQRVVITYSAYAQRVAAR